jgi:ribosomal protein S18 acetylase RimI-like enzyme
MTQIIKVADALPKNIEEKMSHDLAAYEASHGVDVNYKNFALILYDAKEAIVGVLKAYTAFSEIYINDIWVDSNHRGKGYGRNLLEELENMFEGKGFNNINLCTSQFQAPDFYKKCGFQLEFIRHNDANPKFSKFFFSKMFKNVHQDQGFYYLKKEL